MEVVLLLLAAIVELIAGMLLPATILAVELLLTLITFLAVPVSRIFRKAPGPDVEPGAPVSAQATPPALSPFRRWNRRVAIVCGSITFATALMFGVAYTFFLDDAIRALASLAGSRNGIAIEFDSVEPQLLRGELRFQNLRLSRDSHPESNYKVSIGDLKAKFNFTELLKGKRQIEKLVAHGVQGEYERVATADPLAKKPFTIGRLEVADARMIIRDRTAKGGVAETSLAIDSLQIDDYESRWAAFNVMFSSNVHGKIEDDPFEITHGTERNEHWSRWTADRVPLQLVIAYLGGPYRVLSDGRTQVDVTNRWKEGSNPDVDMHWKVTFDDVKAAVPEGANPVVGKFAQPVIEHFNQQDAHLPLDFHVVVPQQVFLGKASLEAAGLWEIVRKSAWRTFEEAVGAKFDAVTEKALEFEQQASKQAREKIEKAREAGKKAIDRVKNLLDERKTERKKKTNGQPQSK